MTESEFNEAFFVEPMTVQYLAMREESKRIIIPLDDNESMLGKDAENVLGPTFAPLKRGWYWALLKSRGRFPRDWEILYIMEDGSYESGDYPYSLKDSRFVLIPIERPEFRSVFGGE